MEEALWSVLEASLANYLFRFLLLRRSPFKTIFKSAFLLQNSFIKNMLCGSRRSSCPTVCVRVQSMRVAEVPLFCRWIRLKSESTVNTFMCSKPADCPRFGAKSTPQNIQERSNFQYAEKAGHLAKKQLYLYKFTEHCLFEAIQELWDDKYGWETSLFIVRYIW